MRRLVHSAAVFGLVLAPVGGARALVGAEFSLRFFGNGVAAPELDRAKIPLDEPHRPVDVGAGDFTVEWWLRASLADNDSAVCSPGADNWIYGNILLDRDVFGAGDWGDWGVSLAGGLIAFGVARGSNGAGLCGSTPVADGRWHHVAVTRRSLDGRLQVFVDGHLDATADGPSGDLSYRDGRAPSYPNEPFLVLGAEKHDAGEAYPSYSGWLEELRLSVVVRYEGAFSPLLAPFVTDAWTAALYHFDEGAGTVIGDSSGAAGGPSDGIIQFGGDPAGPVWSPESPFLALLFADGFETGDLSTWSVSRP